MFFYRILISLFAAGTILKMIAGSMGAGLEHRLGRGRPGTPRQHIWLHAASNGELQSAKPVILSLMARRPDLGLLVTCNTRTGVALAASWDQAGLSARLAPLDLVWINRRLVRNWQVVMHITMEAELWPNRFDLHAGPLVVLGGRMSARTAKGWGRVPGLAARLLARVDLLLAQDADSAQRFLALGMPKAALGPTVDLKAFYAPPALPHDRAVATAFDRKTTWLAASTHPGDEEVVLKAHAIAQRRSPALRLILAPRHPKRAEEVAQMVTDQGLTLARRSTGAPPGTADVFLADTMGEMALWYSVAGRVFVGGTLSDRGGHTPYEPAAFDCALIHGPDVRNFAPAFARLAAADAAIQIETPQELADALIRLDTGAEMTRYAQAAALALIPDNDLHDVTNRLLALLPREEVTSPDLS